MCYNIMKIFVCMTSIPPRAHRLPKVIDSILENIVPPDKIIVSICKHYDRFEEDYDMSILDKYSDNSIVEIHMIEEDMGPATKILGHLPTLLKYDDISDIYLLTADDDLSYRSNFIESFKNQIKKEPETIWTGFSWTRGLPVTTCFGSDGISFKLSELVNLESFSRVLIKNCELIKYHDDMIFSAFFHLNNKKVKKVPGNGSRDARSYEMIDKHALTTAKCSGGCKGGIVERDKKCCKSYMRLFLNGELDSFRLQGN